MISLDRVSFFYPRGPALKNLSMRVEKGVKLAVSGANGSGKSTLALLIKGLLPAAEGEILIDGFRPQELEPGKVGLVFQNPEDQLVAATAEREIAFGLENLGLPRGEMRVRVEEALTIFGLEQYRRHPPHLLSGGQMQLLALASVWALKPDYLILDEPTTMLDPVARRDFRENLKSLPSATAIIFITQRPEECLQYERLLVLKRGELFYDGSPEVFFADGDKPRRAGLEPPLKYKFSH